MGKAEDGGRRSEVGGRKAENERVRRLEVEKGKDQGAAVRRQKSEDGGQKMGAKTMEDG